LEFLYEYGLFLAKAITFVLAVGAIVVLIAGAAVKQQHKKGELDVIDLSEQFSETEEDIIHALLDKDELKEKEKADKKQAKEQAKADKKAAKSGTDKTEAKSHVFVVDFNGSIDAKEVSSLREEVTAILSVAKPEDEVFVRLESGGGMVHGYGLASSQLDRIRQSNIPLTVSVDKVAASGGSSVRASVTGGYSQHQMDLPVKTKSRDHSGRTHLQEPVEVAPEPVAQPMKKTGTNDGDLDFLDIPAFLRRQAD